MLYKHLNQQCKLYVELKSVLTNTHPVNIGLFAIAMGMHNENIEKRNYESHIQLHIGFWPLTHTHTFTYADRVPYKPTITATTIIKYYIAYFDLGRMFFFFYKFILHVCFGLTVCWRLLVVVVTVVVYIAANECGAKSTKICANNKK